MISYNMQKRIEREPSCPTHYGFMHIKEDIGAEVDGLSIVELPVSLSGLIIQYFLPE